MKVSVPLIPVDVEKEPDDFNLFVELYAGVNVTEYPLLYVSVTVFG